MGRACRSEDAVWFERRAARKPMPGIWGECCPCATVASRSDRPAPGLHVLDRPFGPGEAACGPLKGRGHRLPVEAGEEGAADLVAFHEGLPDGREVALERRLG